MMGIQIEVVDETESTNDLAMAAAREGVPSGYAILADRQTGGRGRRTTDGSHRVWYSPAGKNLYLSMVFRPQLAPEKLSALTLVAGIALLETIEDCTQVSPWLKWPNDLYLKEKKVAGILTEVLTGSTGIEAVVIGVGLNVNLQRQDFPPELIAQATSLREEQGESIDRLDLALQVVKSFRAAVAEYQDDGLDAFAHRLRQYDGLVGRAVEVRENGRTRQGAACGIGPRGGLMVRWEDQSSTEVVAGEVLVHGLSSPEARRR